MRTLFKPSSKSNRLAWATLFPVTYLLHIAEEYYCGGGFPQYMLKYYHVDMTEARFVKLQLIGVIAMILGLWLSARLRFQQTMLVIIASVVAINAASHLVRSAANVRYEPGLITGLALWLPLGLMTVHLHRAEMSSARLIFSIAIGVVITGLVGLIQAV